MKVIFTKHAENRLRKRKISHREVKEAINHPKYTRKIRGKYYIRESLDRGNIEIVYERDKYIKVITVYWI